MLAETPPTEGSQAPNEDTLPLIALHHLTIHTQPNAPRETYAPATSTSTTDSVLPRTTTRKRRPYKIIDRLRPNDVSGDLSAKIFTGVWRGTADNSMLKKGAKVIIKRCRVIDETKNVHPLDLGQNEIKIGRKLLALSKNAALDFFAPLVHVENHNDREPTQDLVFEYAGCDLFDVFTKQFPFKTYADETFPLRIKHLSLMTSKVVECVLQMHRAGIVHGDLKPENIVVDDSGKVRLIDFAYSCESVSINVPGIVNVRDKWAVGTEFFIHPHLIWSQQLDLRHADWWAVGQMVWNLYTACLLWEQDPRPSTAERNKIMQFFLHNESWQNMYTFTPELTTQPSFPSFCDFVATMCNTKRQTSGVASMLLLQHPFLCLHMLP